MGHVDGLFSSLVTCKQHHFWRIPPTLPLKIHGRSVGMPPCGGSPPVAEHAFRSPLRPPKSQVSNSGSGPQDRTCRRPWELAQGIGYGAGHLVGVFVSRHEPGNLYIIHTPMVVFRGDMGWFHWWFLQLSNMFYIVSDIFRHTQSLLSGMKAAVGRPMDPCHWLGW